MVVVRLGMYVECMFFFSSRRRHTRCALVTGVQTCALPICGERALFLLHGIQAVVTKNSGGEATYAKIAVARSLDLPVVMIERPTHCAGETAPSVAEALAWIEARL